MSENSHLRFEPEERPPHALAAAMGAQIVAMILTGIMITPLVVSRTAGLDGPTTSWLVFGPHIAAGPP